MFLIEIAHPADAFDDADRDLLADRILEPLLGAGHGPAETLMRAALATHVAFRELRGWRTGDGPPQPGFAPPLIVTVTVPDEWREDGGARHFIGVVRAAVRRLDHERGWDRDLGSLWVRVDGVPDGCIGLDGKPATAADVLDFLTEVYRASVADGRAPEVPDGKLLDPTCGMFVTDAPGVIALEHDGVRVGFCAQGCRDAYAREHGLPV
ncbi:hypothetical protein [Tsukamurella sp. PLM1]|uniref:hypothetical protein n=1 Tax=Tsukamurella sp. PLM1 TaxID=2929795 RepID=UPI00204D8569|nr:hypothetical protein [Tsukamurella sp. PLM1]BDH58014.1 hypothetical protein MTP03_29530 [Tsukamurella sp. PLM1]